MHERFKLIYYNLMGYVYVPDSIKNIKERKLLHISDTPVIFFSALGKLLKELSPDIIIHTGDMVDNIKLEMYKERLPKYEYHLKSIMDMLESSNAKELYICAGNHDNIELLRKYAKKSTIIEEHCHIEIFNAKVALSHYPYKIVQNPADYNFFGHDISIGNDMVNNRIYLNGISTINILTEKTKRLFYLQYPYGTNESRLMKGKIGL
ncbi:metallophosphoesterase [Lutispora saccharofermentans]|uniref:Metallophosphoesterase n=1 Tax=Lutispora saccharofermentans TaxID=3024236 RepID=A0ABT1NHL1_9FIRM|nr:metallophosphoesterase [Lutispora saccharofermentans]MCQ1530559.1 metallophosphoesterase [Lutispora saccharofermentans]